MARSQDFFGIFRGVQLVVRAGINNEEKEITRIWKNSSLRSLLNKNLSESPTQLKNTSSVYYPITASDGIERISTIFTGINQFVRYSTSPSSAPKTVEGAKE